MALRLFFIRHGLSTFNLEKRIQGRDDLSELAELGHIQARATGKALSNLPISAVYSSPLKRAAHTSKLIVEELGQKVETKFDEGLLEVNLGKWSGLTVKEISKKFPNEFDIWKNDPENLILLNTDEIPFKPIKELIGQAKGFLKNLLENHSLNNNSNILIVAHNAILRCLILELLRNSPNSFRRVQLDNTSISIVNIMAREDNSLKAQVECLNNTTHLSSNLPPKGKNARIILVRHGETNWNLEGRFQGQIDIPLNENGKSQAAAAGEFLKKIKLNKAFSSSMSRPIETAEIILRSNPGLRIKLEDGLIEISHGLWEGKLEDEIKSDWPKLLKDWQDAPETVQMPKGESINDVWQRAIDAWKRISLSLGKEDTALVVAHDAVNKTILCYLLGLSPSDIWSIKQGNGGISVIDIADSSDQPDKVTCLNLTSHLGGIIDKTAAGAL